MAVTLTTLETKIRNILGDISETGKDIFTFTNSSVFTPTDLNIQSITSVLKNDVDIGASLWSYSTNTGKVTINVSASAGDTIEIDNLHYPKFSSNEIAAAIESAIYHISVNNYFDWQVINSTVYPEPEIKEQNLITVIAALVLEPDNKSYKLPELQVIVPVDDPVHTKISKIIGRFKKNTDGTFEIISRIGYNSSSYVNI